MARPRNRQRVAALALALLMTGVAAPVAAADDPPDVLDAVAPIAPGRAEPPERAPADDPGATRAAAAVTERADEVWEFFRLANVARVDAGRSPMVQNNGLRALASTWARQQAAAGTYAIDPALEGKITGSWTTGMQAAYVTYASGPAAAAQQIGAAFAGRDWTDAALTDVGIALYEAPYTSTLKRYTLYAIGVDHPHSSPAAGEVTLFRFYRPSTGTHFYSTTVSERNAVVRDAAYRYEGQVAYVLPPSATGATTQSLHRFHQPASGTHFYTSAQSEYQRVLGFPQYRLDGVSGRVHVSGGADRVPMYRFFRPASGTHFYTANAAEAEQVKAMAGYQFEGVAFYLRRAS